MPKSYEVFKNFPILKEIAFDNDEEKYKNYKKLKDIFKEWGGSRELRLSTMNKTDNRKLMKKIGNDKEERLSQIKKIAKNMDNNCNENQKNNFNKHRKFWLNEEMINDLIIELIYQGRLSEFIENNDNKEVKDNPERFEEFCEDILKNKFVDKWNYEPIEEYKDYENNEFGLAEEKNYNVNNDYKSLFFDKPMLNHEKEEKKKENNFVEDEFENKNCIKGEENQKSITKNDVYMLNNDIKEEKYIEKISELIIENVKNSKDIQIKRIFLLAYFTLVEYIDKNSCDSPSDMGKLLKNKDLQNKLSGLSKEEKGKTIKIHLDPMEFWNYFGIDFYEDIKNTSYYDILYQLVSKPDILKKSYEEKEYIAENITRKQYREMERLKEKIFNFIDSCKEQAKKEIDVRSILLAYLKNRIKNIDKNTEKDDLKEVQEYCNELQKYSNEELINDLFEKIKPYFLHYEKTTRQKDIALKYSVLEKLEKENIKPCGYNIFNEEYIFQYAQNRIIKQKDNVIEEHLKTCNKCRRYYEAIRLGVRYREQRDNQVFYILKSPYEPYEVLTEEQYLKNLIIDYYEKEYTKNPCEINCYYLAAAHKRNGNIEDAQKILKEGFEIYKTKEKN